MRMLHFPALGVPIRVAPMHYEHFFFFFCTQLAGLRSGLCDPGGAGRECVNSPWWFWLGLRAAYKSSQIYWLTGRSLRPPNMAPSHTTAFSERFQLRRTDRGREGEGGGEKKRTVSDGRPRHERQNRGMRDDLTERRLKCDRWKEKTDMGEKI